MTRALDWDNKLPDPADDRGESGPDYAGALGPLRAAMKLVEKARDLLDATREGHPACAAWDAADGAIGLIEEAIEDAENGAAS